jgi:hypothetical protein
LRYDLIRALTLWILNNAPTPNFLESSSVYVYVVDSGRSGHGFKTEKTWFEETAGHRYPDAVANVYKSVFTPRVKHTADVLLSIKDGFYYGWSPFGRFVRLRATHGNAMQASSNAFLMSTHRQLPPFVRADDAKVLLRR